MRYFKRTLLAGAVALAVSAPAAAQFTNAIFFGDSLASMPDSVQACTCPGHGSVHDESRPDLGDAVRTDFGFTVTPANRVEPITRTAERASRSCHGFPPTPPIASAVPIATQVSNFLAKGPADPTAIYAIDARRERHLHAATALPGRDDLAGAGAGERASRSRGGARGADREV